MHYPSESVLQFYLLGGDSVAIGAGEPHTYEQLVTAARHVAWHYSLGDPGKFMRPGDMLVCVMDAMAHADMGNMARLCRAFPLHGALMRIVKADNVQGMSMIMNLLDYRGDLWVAGRPAAEDYPLPSLCGHGVTEYGGCKSADCPNAAENLLPYVKAEYPLNESGLSGGSIHISDPSQVTTGDLT